MAAHSSILLEYPTDSGVWWATVHAVTKSQTQQLNNNNKVNYYS